MLKGVNCGTLYVLQGSTPLDSTVVASPEIQKEDMIKLCHKRFGI